MPVIYRLTGSIIVYSTFHPGTADEPSNNPAANVGKAWRTTVLGPSSGPDSSFLRFILLSQRAAPRGVVHPQEIQLGKRIFKVLEVDAAPLRSPGSWVTFNALWKWGHGFLGGICGGAGPEEGNCLKP